jgi:hypothetical protein
MSTPSAVPEAGLLDNLSRRSRAYNALYGIGWADPATVPTLTDEQVSLVIEVAQQALAMRERTEMHAKMMQLPLALLRYVARGGL